MSLVNLRDNPDLEELEEEPFQLPEGYRLLDPLDPDLPPDDKAQCPRIIGPLPRSLPKLDDRYMYAATNELYRPIKEALPKETFCDFHTWQPIAKHDTRIGTVVIEECSICGEVRSTAKRRK